MKYQVLRLRCIRLTYNFLHHTCCSLSKSQIIRTVSLRGRRHLVILRAAGFEMSDKAEIQKQIKEQGEVVRRLKLDHAEKERVFIELFVFK